MARIEKTVFISYRRTDVYTALAVYENLKNQGYDVFFDYRSISSGDFEQIIISNIRARAHFLLILTPTALDRCSEPGDWLRREIELAIDEKRNIIPLLFKGFQFSNPAISEKLIGKLKNISRYNGLNVHEDYFDEAMQRLRSQFLNIPLDTVLHPVSTEVLKVVRDEQVAADRALEQIDDVKGLVGQTEAKTTLPVAEPYPKHAGSMARDVKKSPNPRPRFNASLIGSVVVGLLILALLVWGMPKLFLNLDVAPTLTQAIQPDLTSSPQPLAPISPSEGAITSAPSETTMPPVSETVIGSTMMGRDGMILLYVPAGPFTMGMTESDSQAQCEKYNPDCQGINFKTEEPPHTVDIAAFWIDSTEVTNYMYATCVRDGACNPPDFLRSSTHLNYFGNPEFDNYPVIYVSWDDANAYCSWAGRRLPSEAEWEKAARGPNENIYPWGNDFDGALVNFCDANCSDKQLANNSFSDGYEDVSPVGSYPAGKSVYGALDMGGNVWEWVNDWFDVYPGGDSTVSDDFGQKERVLRGGAFYGRSIFVRGANRFSWDPVKTRDSFGFRCAMDATP